VSKTSVFIISTISNKHIEAHWTGESYRHTARSPTHRKWGGMQELYLNSKMLRIALLPLKLALQFPTYGTEKVPLDHFGTKRPMRTGFH